VRTALGGQIWGSRPENVALGSLTMLLIAGVLFAGAILAEEGMPRRFGPLIDPVVQWEVPPVDDGPSSGAVRDDRTDGSDGADGSTPSAPSGPDRAEPQIDAAAPDDPSGDDSASDSADPAGGSGSAPAAEDDGALDPAAPDGALEPAPTETADGAWCNGEGAFALRLQAAAVQAGIEVPPSVAGPAYEAGNDWPVQHQPCSLAVSLTADDRLLIRLAFRDARSVRSTSLLMEQADGAFVALDPQLVESDHLDWVTGLPRVDPRIDLAVANVYLYSADGRQCGGLERVGGSNEYVDVEPAVFGVATQYAVRIGAIPVVYAVAVSATDQSVREFTFDVVRPDPGSSTGVGYGDRFLVHRSADGSAWTDGILMNSDDPCPIEASSLRTIATRIVEAVEQANN
jgi:hypothetical protein